MTFKTIFIFKAYLPDKSGQDFVKICAESQDLADQYLKDNGYFGIQYCGQYPFIFVDSEAT